MYQQLATLLRRARRGVSFSGAGLSVGSGLPTYRGAGGLWTTNDPDLLTERRLLADPAEFWRFFRARWLRWTQVEPNPAHRALAAMEEAGYLAGHVTQNIDGLLQGAGARRVVELHGHLRSLHCMACEAPHPIDCAEQEVPRCTRCGGLLRPDVVLFGDPLSEDAWREAVRLLGESDLVLVVGTSLQVEPAASLLQQCRAHAPTIVIDPGEVWVRGEEVYYLREPAEVALPALWRVVGQ